ncbi:MAG: hypothetical protein ASARMPREDX12_002971 [Alectoria sarmentosa]|nr:MAG: hypothetical protein ASARMPREDX12_002971 [Alectoria sarmentosa]
MYLPLTLIPLSTINVSTALPGTLDKRQPAVAARIISPTSTPVIGSFDKRQPAYAPVETHQPILEVLAGSATDALQERPSDADDSFDSLLCATLKALNGENPTIFKSLLQSCTSLTDSSSTRRTKTIKERVVVDDKKDLATGIEAAAEVDVEGSGEAVLARGHTDLPEKRDLDTENIGEKRQSEGFDSLLCATLKELVAEDSARFISLSSWCNSMTDSASR